MFTSGEKVVLVNDGWPPFIAMYDFVPIKHRVYTVRDVRLGRTKEKNSENPEDDCEVAITLEEGKNGPDPLCSGGLIELGFRADRFRKVDEIKEKQKKAIAKPIKQGELF
jgi:hypothetical protein